MARNHNIPASYLFLLKDNKTLILKRQNTGYEDGNYSLVAGHVDEGETFTDAVIREAYEEANIILKPQNLKVIHVMHRKSLDSIRVDVFFTATSWEGEIINKEPKKCSELIWIDIKKLPENTILYIREAIKNIQNKIFYSEIGWGEYR